MMDSGYKLRLRNVQLVMPATNQEMTSVFCAHFQKVHAGSAAVLRRRPSFIINQNYNSINNGTNPVPVIALYVYVFQILTF